MVTAQKIVEHGNLNVRGDASLFWEVRIEYSGTNPIYVAYNKTPNASTSDPTWYIFKNTFDGSDNLTRKQLPDSGAEFKYAYDDRVSLFS